MVRQKEGKKERKKLLQLECRTRETLAGVRGCS